MQRETCLELSHLPTLSSRIKSINFRRTTPGSISRLAYSRKPPSPKDVLDPSHPALLYNGWEWNRAFAWSQYPSFAMRTFPKALLDKPSPMHPDPPYSLNDGPVKGHSLNMSLLDCAPKSVGGRVLRQETLRKFKTAISLIVVRGADVVTEEDGTPRLIFNEVEAGDAITEEYAVDDKRWILSDWTYIIRPELPLYTMPYVSFIPCLREALQRSYVTGRRLEQEWAQTKAATIKSRGSVMLGTSKVPIKLPKGYSKQTEQAATLLMDRLKQIKGNSSPGEREADTDAKTGAGGSIGSEETTGRSSLALDRLIERHSKSGLDSQSIRDARGVPRPDPALPARAIPFVRRER